MPEGPMRWRRVRALALVVVVAGVLGGGCADGDGRRDDGPTTTGAPTTSGGDTTATTGTSVPTTATSAADPAARPTVPPVADPDGFEARPLEPEDPIRGAGPMTLPADPPACTPEPGKACLHDDG